jgi:hypothetical protein
MNGRSLSRAELDAAIDDQIKKEAVKAWTAWGFRLAAIVAGVFGAIRYLSRPLGRYLWIVLLAIAAHLILWIWPFAAEGKEGLVAFRAFGAAILDSGSWMRMLEFMILSVLFPVIEIICFLGLALSLTSTRRALQ